MDLIATHPLLTESPYVGYSYSYPHKTAYRRLDPAVELRTLWESERRDSLFLYLHVPFCEFRCGFCNLFTLAQPEQSLPERYLQQLRREAEQVRDSLGDARFVRLAIGGGTPTFFSVAELTRLLAVATEVLGVKPSRDGVPVSVEASPATIDAEKLALLREFGTERISLGVQSFDEMEAGLLGRPQRLSDVIRSIELIRATGFPILNLDLIYGGEGQTLDSWRATVQRTLEFAPEEIYLYPLYVRPLTGLGRTSRHWDDERLAAYRAGRDWLLEAGYEQVSMRMFRGESRAGSPCYCCQSDGMIGLGCGARSYTTGLHYSTEFAVGKTSVQSILTDYVHRDPRSFASARHGYRLTPDDQRRRFVILSLLQSEGLSRDDYRQQFQSNVDDDLVCLLELAELGLAKITSDRITLTAAGLERSDAIGPWLYSEPVRRRMEEYECR